MKKLYNVGVLLAAVAMIGVFAPVYGEDENLLAKIASLEQQLSQKDAVLMEQVKVILELAENQVKDYESFSKEKFPLTGGFNPEWLAGERVKILESCQEASDMGYDPPYCQYVK